MNKEKNIKVGILTYHNGFNYGAFLQAYALQKYLKNIGYDNSIIDYKNMGHWYREYKHFLFKKNLNEIILNTKKILAFKKDLKELKLTKRQFKKFDTIIVGSDTVWDFNDAFTGLGRVYFGHKLKTNNLISYAASFGSSDKALIMPAFVKNGLKKFNSISVRDKNSYDIIRFLTDKNAEIVVDPIFLVENYKQKNLCPYDNFILVYSSKITKEYAEELKRYSQKNGKKIISIGFQHNWCDINEIAIGPFEWLEYIRKADLVITNTFHGTLFSIKFNKEFILFITANKVNKYSPILEILELMNRVPSQENSLSDILRAKIDYKSVNQKLYPLIRKSQKYLKHSLNAN